MALHSNKENKERNVDLLWTGGWDSTFRLLQIVLEEKKVVQPHYILFNDRWSKDKEIETMNQIKKMVFSDYPFTQNLINETIFIEEDEIGPDQAVSQLYEVLKREKYIGNQYDAIVRYAKQFQFDNLEIGTEGSGNTYAFVKPHVGQIDGKRKVDSEKAPEHIYNFYKYFNFPLLNYSKQEMAESAGKKGWLTILNNTWICHKPIFGSIPCGACNPCINAAKDEFAKNRLPLISRMMGKPVKKIYNSRIIKYLFR
ncbi:hypothetical protein [Fodinibius sp.]|uniref:hypothetical protein n=1 Tax=Fodinibius sp. TaxID=1872440 RepID=UPI003569649E